jgi:carboxyl-terminal processing protease
MQVRSGSPAEEAGLKVGDIVTQVDGERPQGMGAIRGKPGTSVTLTVKRGETSSTMTITRADLSKATPPEVAMVGADAAVLRLESFTEGYEKPLLNRLMKQVKDTPYLVIDLRSNGGGSVDNLSHLLGLLLPQGTPVGTFVSKRMVADYEEKTGKKGDDVVAVAQWASRKLRPQRVGGIEPYKGRVAVLINGASASASEILAAAMRELRGAPLVGTKSAGAVLLSTYVRMEGGFEMKVPTSDYVTIEGERLESNPLVPDRTVGNRWGRRGAPVAPDDDPVVQAALDALRENADAGALPRE